MERSRELLNLFHTERNKPRPPSQVLKTKDEVFLELAENTGKLMKEPNLSLSELAKTYRALHAMAQGIF